jgi:hypothetical protein
VTKRSHEKQPGKLHQDANEIAFRTVQAVIGEAEKPIPPEERTDVEKDPTAVQRGREGGKKGGKARARTLSPEERAEIAKLAASVRWKKNQQESD